jgi:hypothetical protein
MLVLYNIHTHVTLFESRIFHGIKLLRQYNNIFQFFIHLDVELTSYWSFQSSKCYDNNFYVLSQQQQEPITD